MFRNAALILCLSAVLPAAADGAPAEEIAKAVAVNNGVTDVAAARPKQFLKAFTSVALRANPRDLPDYVVAAINLRPDLASTIAAVAVKAAVKNWEGKPNALCAMINRIINAAIAANPDAVVLIVKAGAGASPELRHCVVTGAISAAPMAKEAIIQAATAKAVPFAFLTFSATDTSGFSFTAATLSPANISDLENDTVNSPEQPPTP
jgi:hypothetical protein